MKELLDPSQEADGNILRRSSRLKEAQKVSKQSLGNILNKRKRTRGRKAAEEQGGFVPKILASKKSKCAHHTESYDISEHNLVDEVQKRATGVVTLEDTASALDIVHDGDAEVVHDSSTLDDILGKRNVDIAVDHDDFESDGEEKKENQTMSFVLTKEPEPHVTKEYDEELDRKAIESYFKKKETEICRNVHYVHLSLLVAKEWERSILSNNKELQSLLLELSDFSTIPKSWITLTELSDLMKTFRRHFDNFDDEIRLESSCLEFNSCLKSKLKKALAARSGGIVHVNLLFLCLCRALGISCRWVSKMYPLAPQPSKLKTIFAATLAEQPLIMCEDCPNSEDNSNKLMSRNEILQNGKKYRSSKKKSTKKKRTKAWRNSSEKYESWVEVWVEDENRFVHVDAFYDMIDNCRNLDGKKNSCFYFIACGLRIKDVSKRYTDRWSNLLSKRYNASWFEEHISVMNKVLDLSEEDHVMEKADDDEMDAISKAESIPSSVAAVKKHPLFCIEESCNRYEGIYPKYPILGMVGSHKVYPRENLKELQTEKQWFRSGYEIRKGEVPYKTVPSRFYLQDNDLYGEWQTEVYVPPEAIDGIVPKNSRGNVDMWTKGHLPRGTVHLGMPRIRGVVKRLGIDHAPAMIGFDKTQGRWIPVFDGIVIAEENQQIALEAYRESESRRREKAKEKETDENINLWIRFIRSAMAIREMKEKKKAKKRKKKNGKEDNASHSSPLKSEHAHSFNIRQDQELQQKVRVCDCGFETGFEEF